MKKIKKFLKKLKFFKKIQIKLDFLIDSKNKFHFFIIKNRHYSSININSQKKYLIVLGKFSR